MDYSSCTLCPNLCSVDRRKTLGICRQSDKVRIAWSGLHRGEEPPITGEKGSGMIFFTGCPLHCQFCQNRQISGSDGMNLGIEITDEELAGLMLSLQKDGAATLNLVTGTHFIPSIINALKIAESSGFSLPVVWNSSGYESVEALAMIDDYIDIYLLDCKTLSRNTASKWCGKARYADVIIPVMDAIKAWHPVTDMDRMKGTILFALKLIVPALAVVTIGYYAGADVLISLFMKNETIIAYGSSFLRGFCLGIVFLSIDFLAVGVFQALGLGRYALVFAIMRKVVLEIPALIILNRLFPLYGLAYAQFVAELILSICAVVMLGHIFRKYGKKQPAAVQRTD